MFQHGKDTRAHDEKDLLEVQMAETKVPMKELFLQFRKTHVGTINDGQSGSKGFDGLVGIFRMQNLTGWKGCWSD